MTNRELVERIAEYHRREADEEYYREVGDDAVYDKITWENLFFLDRSTNIKPSIYRQ